MILMIWFNFKGPSSSSIKISVTGSSLSAFILRSRAVGLLSPRPPRLGSSASFCACDFPNALIRAPFISLNLFLSGGLIRRPWISSAVRWLCSRILFDPPLCFWFWIVLPLVRTKLRVSWSRILAVSVKFVPPVVLLGYPSSSRLLPYNNFKN